MKSAVALTRQAVVSAEARVVLAVGTQSAASGIFALLTARWLGPDARGALVLVMTTSSFLMLAGSLGIGTGARVLLNGSPPLALPQFLTYARALSAIHLVTSASLGVLILFGSGGLPSPWLAVFFVPFAALQLYSYLQREALHGLAFHGWALSGDVLASCLQTAAVIWLELTGTLTLLAAAGTLLLGAVVQALFLARRLRSVQQPGPFAAMRLGSLVRYSLPAMVTMLGQAFVIRGDRLVLGALAGSAAVGLYGTAATFSEVLWLIPVGVSQVVFQRSSVASSRAAAARSRSAALLVTVLSGALLAALCGFLIPLLLGEAYRPAIPLTYVLIAASMPMASYQLDVAVLNGLGRLREASRITMMGSVVLLLVCLLTIPAFGAQGAAWSSLASYSVMALKARLDVRRGPRPEATPEEHDRNG